MTVLVLPQKVLSDGDPVGIYNANDRGSDRGSGYLQSNPILRHCDKLFATWQRYDKNAPAKFTVCVSTNQLGTGIWSPPVALLYPATLPPMDNHGGASIIADSQGYLHLFYGAHHWPMLEAVSANPWDASNFNSPQVVPTPTTDTSYSSVVRDAAGTFHLLYRGTDNTGVLKLLYQRRAATSSAWSPAVALASTGVGNAYSLYNGAIAIAPNGHLHVAFELYSNAWSSASPGAYAWGCLQSVNGGISWLGPAGNPASLPTTPNKLNQLVESAPSIDVRIGNIAVSPNGLPWVSVTYVKQASVPFYETKLWHRSATGGWSSVPLSPAIPSLPDWRIAGASITFDAQGLLYAAAERVRVKNPPDTTPDSWFAGVTKQVVLLTSANTSAGFQVDQISSPAPAGRPRWLANIERPTTPSPIAVPSFLYLDGHSSDPAAPSNVYAPIAGDVVFVPLYKY